ncbi:acyl-CoA dehydrogenase [Solirubrobacter taibaiensis]|nr:acyl-CoA dehydrogenase [Solirubrobacter taibaiensis]
MLPNDLRTLAESLECHLGDPHDPHSAMSFARVLELDEREQYPHELVSALQCWGLHEYVVPAADGGRAVDIHDGYSLFRLVARRDATTATAMSITALSFMPIWIAAGDEQRRRFATGLQRGLRLAWGLSERAHGSDILANEMVAERVDGGYVLSGEKWLIGNATVADVVLVFARTGESGAPAGYSIFAVEKRALPAGAVEPLAHEPLLGLRGIDMSGIRLNGCRLPESARIGPEGAGLEIALKSSQLARGSITSIALGCVDTALRVTLDFAREREIFGRRVLDIPYSRRQLAECFADLMIAEATALGAVRGLQVTPAQSSIATAVAKYVVPTLLEGTLAQLAVVLGARHFLRGDARHAMFQKALRDIRVVNFADGNTVVNLKVIAGQLARLVDRGLGASEPERDEAAVRVATQFGLDRELPPYRPAEQEVFARGCDDILVALPRTLARLEEETPAAAAGERIMRAVAELQVELQQLRRERGREAARSSELYALAERYCLLNAAACCLHMYVHNPDAMDSGVLMLSLERLAMRLRWPEPLAGPADVEATAGVLEHLHAQSRLFSILPISLPAASRHV